MSAAGLDLSVVIPAYNEARRLQRSLPLILAFLETRQTSFEVIVVDDGSVDLTLEQALHYGDRQVRGLRLLRNSGKGAAVRHGIAHSRGRQVLICDADLSTPIEELTKLQAALGQAPVIIGSRAVHNSTLERRQPWHRRWMGRGFRLLTSWVGVRQIRDTQCGFKLLDGRVARRLFRSLVTNGFAFDVELLWLTQKQGLDIVEVGVRWADDRDTRVRPVRDSLHMLSEMLAFRLHHRRAASLVSSGVRLATPIRRLP